MFWDSSALVPLLVREETSTSMAALLAQDDEPTLWWASPVECCSALQRRHREGLLDEVSLAHALRRLEELVEDVDCVAAATPVRQRAVRMLATHALRAADSLQLAAALIWTEESPNGQRFVCLDERLRQAARREGFAVLPEP